MYPQVKLEKNIKLEPKDFGPEWEKRLTSKLTEVRVAHKHAVSAGDPVADHAPPCRKLKALARFGTAT